MTASTAATAVPGEIFRRWQPAYAERGIATFPVTEAKVPGISNWQRVGLKGSSQLAAKFNSADAFGFVTGGRSNITVLDIDTTDEKVVRDAIARHGQPGIVTRTASGKFHLLYRYNGERRRIRPWKPLPIDLLGDNGYAVAAPSRIARGSYEIIHGRLDDVHELAPMAELESLDEPKPAPAASDGIREGARNNTLWRACMKAAKHCDDFDALLDFARTRNEEYVLPLGDKEAMRAAHSAWGYTQRGENRFGEHGAWFPIQELTTMFAHQDALILLAFLRAHNGPQATFMCANGIAEMLGWRRHRMAAARQRLAELGYLESVKQAGRGHAALFRWRKGVQN